MNVHAPLRFLAAHTVRPVFGPSTGGAAAQSTLIGDFEDRVVEILDGRCLDERFDLDTQGFALHSLAPAGNLYDRSVIAQIHDAQCRQLVTEATGAGRVEIFDHTWRSTEPGIRERHSSREPSAFIHNDYTPRSAVKRIHDLMGAEAASLARGDFAIVNVWRPIESVRSAPVALCDARTIAADSLVPAERRAKARTGEIFLVHYGADQRWIYFPEMQTDEVLLIKTYDSRTDGRARWSPHTSFDAPDDGSIPPPRESIETRLFVFLG